MHINRFIKFEITYVELDKIDDFEKKTLPSVSCFIIQFMMVHFLEIV